jgi:hypothetical protein
MSHITKGTTEISSIESLKSACEELGFKFMQDQKKYEWYGRYVGDTKLPDDVDMSKLGQCEHAIRVPGAGYEIGVVKLPNGKYTLLYDYWGQGAKLEQAVPQLVQMYGVHFNTALAKQAGKQVFRQTFPNGRIRLSISGGF